MARNPAAAAGFTGFLLLWSGILVVLIQVDAPAIFPIVTGLFELLLIVAALDMWLEVSRVVVD